MGDLVKQPVGSSKPHLSSFSVLHKYVDYIARATTVGSKIAFRTPSHRFS